MNCWHCNTKLIWGGDFDGEDYGVEEEYSIVTNLSCPFPYKLRRCCHEYLTINIIRAKQFI